MRERPIIFSTTMVQAILEGRKTMTRRVVKPQPKSNLSYFGWNIPEYTHVAFGNSCRIESMHRNPFGDPGDVLWVRETFQYNADFMSKHRVPYFYKTDKVNIPKWKPSIHMPKAAARIWLEITDVKIERLHDISENDSIREGINDLGFVQGYPHAVLFSELWESIHGKESWWINPWVWVITFKRIEK